MFKTKKKITFKCCIAALKTGNNGVSFIQASAAMTHKFGHMDLINGVNIENV